MQTEVMRIESQQKKRSKPITFADYFKVDENKLKELGCFNPILNFDTIKYLIYRLQHSL